MRVRDVRENKPKAGGFKTGVGSLNGLMDGRQILPGDGITVGIAEWDVASTT
jgi:hypothetical protein